MTEKPRHANSARFSSKSCEWATPQYVFDALDKEFQFTLDPCANDTNHKCAKYYTKEQDGLQQDWSGERIYLNPPYGRGIDKWVKKLSETDAPVRVALLPMRSDTNWFHNYVLGKAEIRYVKGRLRFNDCKSGAPFGSIIVIYNN